MVEFRLFFLLRIDSMVDAKSSRLYLAANESLGAQQFGSYHCPMENAILPASCRKSRQVLLVASFRAN